MLAFDANAIGLGYAVLEGPNRLLDWGMTRIRMRYSQRCIERVRSLIERYEPELIVVEDVHNGFVKGQKARDLIKSAVKIAKQTRVPVREISAHHVFDVFSSSAAFNKDQIAMVIGSRFPGLSYRLPNPRKYQGEGEQYWKMSIFDAVALVITFFREENGKSAR